ncbi:hypothetical protein [Lonsdalea quercina]|uniref:hypothetical protein n=1 Tax=Lonsdalea quercina TaxID=71657 RepID=UPI003974C432
MIEDKCAQYLILGGARHGEIYIGPVKHGEICISVDPDNQVGKFYSQEMKAEVLEPLVEVYIASEFHSKDGKCYMIASNESLSDFDVEKEIAAVFPALEAIE